METGSVDNEIIFNKEKIKTYKYNILYCFYI